jgi:drug/metabolite transporter (DMT)-like permease
MVGPVSTLFLGALILGEPITAIQLGGTALVMAGIYMLSTKK